MNRTVVRLLDETIIVQLQVPSVALPLLAGYASAAQEAAAEADADRIAAEAAAASSAANAAAVDAVADQLVEVAAAVVISEEAPAFAVTDNDGNAALVVDKDGTVQVAALEAETLNGATAADLAAASALTEIVQETEGQFAWAVTDDDGDVALAVRPDGTAEAKAIIVETINGIAPEDLLTGIPYPDGTFGAELTYFANVGQSLGEGSNGQVTVVQEHDNVGFPAHSTAPAAYLPLTVANCEVPGRGEAPMFGALAAIKQLVAAEEGLAHTDHGYQLLAANNAVGGSTIAGIDKGSTPYDETMSQVQAGFDIAQAEGRTFAMGAVFFTQGESNNGDSRVGYRDAIIQFAADVDADAKAITGQGNAIPFITYQTNAGAWPGIAALAQLDAHVASPLVTMAGPTYQLQFYDAVHINADSSRRLGALYGLAYKRVAIDGEAWEPVRPMQTVLKQGKLALVRFHVPVKPLVMDTVTLAAQVDMGFKIVSAGDIDLGIATVEVVGPDTVRIECAVTIPAGARLLYGNNASVGRTDAYIDGSGNLRDSQGDRIIFDGQRLDNWCVFFEHIL